MNGVAGGRRTKPQSLEKAVTEDKPKVEPVPRKDYGAYLEKLESVNYKKEEKIAEFVQEVKAHQLRRIQYFESLERNKSADMR